MRVLVTGAAGFIGSHLCDELALGHEVVGVDDLSAGNPDHVDVPLVRKNVLEVDFDFRPEVVFHLAAYAAETRSHVIRQHIARNNYEGTTRIVSLCRRHAVRLLVFVSSAAVYGETNGRAAVEEDVQPIDPYGIAKYSSELDIRASGLPHTILRPHNVYGPRQNLWDPHRNVVGRFLGQTLAGEGMTVYGSGRQRRCFTEVSDVVRVLMAAIDDSRLRGVFSVGHEVPTTVLELARMIGGSVTREPARAEATDVLVSHEKLGRLGYTCPTSLAAGLARMRAWAETAEPWETRVPEEER